MDLSRFFVGYDTADAWIALFWLTAMEIVLGIDNIVFISILTSRLPEASRLPTARIGLFLALFMRIALLMSLAWVMHLRSELFTFMGVHVTGKSLVLLFGGLFLVGKSVTELHKRIEGEDEHGGDGKKGAVSVRWILVQIVLLDLVFSLDSVITAVGMVDPDEIWVMVIAVISAVIAMLAGAKPISEFVSRHPTVKVLALSFLILIGVMLVAEGLGQHIPKGYIYFAMAFALGVELINLRVRSKEAGAKARISMPNPGRPVAPLSSGE